MYCANCGKEIKPGAKFCGNCGAPAVQEKAPNINREIQNRRVFKWLAIIFECISAVVFYFKPYVIMPDGFSYYFSSQKVYVDSLFPIYSELFWNLSLGKMKLMELPRYLYIIGLDKEYLDIGSGGGNYGLSMLANIIIIILFVLIVLFIILAVFDKNFLLAGAVYATVIFAITYSYMIIQSTSYNEYLGTREWIRPSVWSVLGVVLMIIAAVLYGKYEVSYKRQKEEQLKELDEKAFRESIRKGQGI